LIALQVSCGLTSAHRKRTLFDQKRMRSMSWLSSVRRIKIGDQIPNAQLVRLERNELLVTNLADQIANKVVVIVGVPGAYTPTCSNRHVPDMVANHDRLKMAGIDEIICVATNDPWVMAAWAKVQDPEGKLIFLSDANLEFATATGLRLNAGSRLRGVRLKRFLVVADNRTVRRMTVEDDDLSFTCTMAAAVFEDTATEEISRLSVGA
jgi:2-Cys peroxiredoxin 5